MALAGCLVSLTACRGAPADARAAVAPRGEITMMADSATISVPHVFAGQVYVERDVAIAARAAGSIDSLFVQLGASVATDALMASIDNRAQEIERARANVALDRAQRARSRSRDMGPRGGVTPVDSERVEQDVRDAELTVRKAQHELELTRVTAPFGGRVTSRYVRPHQMVAVGDTLFRLAETGPQLVRVRVNEQAAKSVRVGDRAVAISGTARESGRVTYAAPSLDPASGTREIILQLGSSRFLTGETVTVEIGNERRRAIVAPRAAVSADGFVLVVDGARTTVRPVTVGAAVSGDRIEVVSGLTAGEKLALPRR